MMIRQWGWVLVVLCGMVPAAASAEAAARECHRLSCDKCAKICRATCDSDYKACDAKQKRGCPGLYRSCERGCKSELCAQCMPIQYDGNNRKFLPGNTDLCPTPGHRE